MTVPGPDHSDRAAISVPPARTAGRDRVDFTYWNQAKSRWLGKDFTIRLKP